MGVVLGAVGTMAVAFATAALAANSPKPNFSSGLSVGTPVATSTRVEASSSSVTLGHETGETFTATVKAASGSAKPSGSVSISASYGKGGTATPIDTCTDVPLSASGVATCKLTSGSELPKPGEYTVTADYTSATPQKLESSTGTTEITVKK